MVPDRSAARAGTQPSSRWRGSAGGAPGPPSVPGRGGTCGSAARARAAAARPGPRTPAGRRARQGLDLPEPGRRRAAAPRASRAAASRPASAAARAGRAGGCRRSRRPRCGPGLDPAAQQPVRRARPAPTSGPRSPRGSAASSGSAGPRRRRASAASSVTARARASMRSSSSRRRTTTSSAAALARAPVLSSCLSSPPRPWCSRARDPLVDLLDAVLGAAVERVLQARLTFFVRLSILSSSCSSWRLRSSCWWRGSSTTCGSSAARLLNSSKTANKALAVS